VYHVYVLQSLSDPDRIYVGFSAVDVETRLKRHNQGSTPATHRYRPWKLAWYGSFPDKARALAFEAYLKSGSGRAFLRKRLIG
jgi:predicted GIY-YIG superfamily endonuclease